MVKLLTYMNKMIKKPSFTIGKRITLLQTRSVWLFLLYTSFNIAASLRSRTAMMVPLKLSQLVFLVLFSNNFQSNYCSLSKNQSDVFFDKFIEARNANSDDSALSLLVADKLWTFVKSRALRWKMNECSDLMVSAGDKGKINLGLSVDAKRAFIEGRGKMKNSGPIIAAIVLKGVLLGLLAFKALFLLSGKALLISKLSLLLASLIGVKKLLSGKQKSVSYEIVNDHHRYDHFKPQAASPAPVQAQAEAQTQGWQRALDITLDSFIENFAGKFI